MQSKTSCFNKTIFKKNILHFWPIWALYTVVLLALLPLYVIVGTVNSMNMSAAEIKSNNFLYYVMGLENSMDARFIFVAAVICAMTVFYYMYHSKSVNMLHAFPVDRKQLYVTNYLSGLLFLWIPELFTFFVTVMLCLIKGIGYPEYLLIWLLMVMGMSLFAYSMAVVIGMLTGQLFTVPVFFFIANYLYMAIRFVVMALYSQLSFGVSADLWDVGTSDSVLSPLFWMHKNARISVLFKSNGGYSASITGEREIAVYAVVAILFAVLGYVLYQRKELETTGDFITRNWLKPIFRWGSTILFSGLAGAGVAEILECVLKGNEIFGVLFVTAVCAFLVFIISQMLLEKSFKVFTKNRITEGLVAVAVMVLIVVGVKCDITGMERKVPKAEEVESVFLCMSYPIEMTDEKEIEEVLKIHKKIIENKDTLQETAYEENAHVLTIRYCCKDGSVLERSYEIPLTKEYYEDKDSVLYWTISKEMQYENSMKNMFGENYESSALTKVEIELYNTVTKTYENMSIPTVYVEEFYEALKADIKEKNINENVYLQNAQTDNREVQYVPVSMEFYNSKGISDMSDKFYGWEYEEKEWKNSTTYLEINKNCKHMLKVIKKSGIVDETHILKL